jgi:hypothetical protein
MSIYQGRTKYVAYDAIHETPVQRSGQPARNAPGQQQDWSQLRKAQPVDRLLPIGQGWMARLPQRMTPSALAAEYPRIANLLALQWNDRRACSAYFEELLTDRRGGRKGFPDAVYGDLLKLRDYFYASQPALEEIRLR